MANPSTIWAQLSIPNSAVGSIPYVATDGVTIVTDVLHFNYVDGTVSVLVGSQLAYQLTLTNGLRVSYGDTTAVPAAAVTINKSAGRVKIPIGVASVVVTNSNCFLTSIIHLQLEYADATLTRVVVIPAAGSFTITGNANATVATQVSFIITNVY